MAALLIVLVLTLWALWWTWPKPTPERAVVAVVPDQERTVVVMDLPAHSRARQRLWRRSGAPALTEDDLITFGLQLEATDDVVGELLSASS